MSGSTGTAAPQLQFLAPDGALRLAPAQARAHADHLAALTPDRLRAMYRDMALTRAFDDEATALQRQGELGLWVQSRGQEAAQIGSAHALAPQDHAFPSYREHGVVHVRGVDFAEILPMFRGVDHGGWDTAAHGCNLYTLVVGAHSLHATGYAMGLAKEAGAGRPPNAAVIAYVGDGAMSQGDVNESMIFAASYNAPIVFFCQNNGWAISTPTERQSRGPLARRGEGFGFPSARIDGNDVIAAYAATAGALERARAGQGPSLIEAVTYRMGAHTTADDPTRYRTADQEAEWLRRDPIARLRAHLEGTGAADAAFFAEVAAAGAQEAAAVRAACLALAPPALADAFPRAYAAPHPLVEEEAAWWAGYAAHLDLSPLGGGR